MIGVRWAEDGLRGAAAQLGHTFTVGQCVIWASAFKANNPSVVAVYNLGATADGQIAVQCRDHTGQVLVITAPVMA